MQLFRILPVLALAFTMGLFLLPLVVSTDSLWGINHLMFLGNAVYGWLLAITSVALVVIAAAIPVKAVSSIVYVLDKILFQIRWGKVILALAFGLLFVFFRAKTHFLGDGYAWLGALGQGEVYIHKWTEPGSTLLFRSIQTLLGGYTESTALLTFQSLSVFSGMVVVYFLTAIVGRVASKPESRILALATLIFSGSFLLFFGYVEFYPLMWAFMTAYLYVALRCMEGDSSLRLATLLFLLGVLMHLQMAALIGGLVWLYLAPRYLPNAKSALTKKQKAFLAFIPVILFVTYVILVNTVFRVKMIALWPIVGRPPDIDYALFSVKHFSDLLNLTLLILPGILVVLALAVSKRGRQPMNKQAIFFLVSSLGSLSFLFFIDPFLGMARDWDLMSFALFCPALYLVYQLSRRTEFISRRLLMPYVVMCGLITITYVAANISVKASESRIQSLLHQAGPKERNGWLMHARYWMHKSDTARAIEIRNQADELFPAYAQLDIARQNLSVGNFDLALSIADKLVAENPYQVDFLGLQAEVYVAAGRFEEAIASITQAGRIKPSSPVLQYQLGEIYAQRGQHSLALQSYKKARVWGSTNSSILEAIGFTYSRMGLLDSA